MIECLAEVYRSKRYIIMIGIMRDAESADESHSGDIMDVVVGVYMAPDGQ